MKTDIILISCVYACVHVRACVSGGSGQPWVLFLRSLLCFDSRLSLARVVGH